MVWAGPGVGVLALTTGLPLGACRGCVRGEQQEGRTEKPAALAAGRGDLCALGLFLRARLHLLMCCVSMEKTVKLSNRELPR